MVGLAIACPVQTVTDCLARGCLHRRDTAQSSEGRLAGEPLRVIARGDEQDRGNVGAYALGAGPATAPWKGRNKPMRQDRKWARAWSPEQISNRLRIEFPDNDSMRISHEAIYQALYVQGRGALRKMRSYAC
jgi:hypothetical protein